MIPFLESFVFKIYDYHNSEQRELISEIRKCIYSFRNKEGDTTDLRTKYKNALSVVVDNFINGKKYPYMINQPKEIKDYPDSWNFYNEHVKEQIASLI